MSEPTADDRAREALTEQFHRQEPRVSKDTYAVQEWHDTFERPWVIPNKRYLANGGGDAYCRLCAVEKKHGKLAAFRLHVALEDDVMQVAKYGLIHVTCHNCGFDMLIPRSPKIRGMSHAGAVFDEYSQLGNKMQEIVDRSLAQSAREIDAKYEQQVRVLEQQFPGKIPEKALEHLRRYIERYRLSPLGPNKRPLA